MLRPLAKLAFVTGLVLVVPTASRAGDGARHATAVERYGLEGHIQPIGLHHGFHIVQVRPGSPADQDRLEAHDVIVKVDGEIIRNLGHLQSLLTDAAEDDGKVLLTILKHGALEHHVVSADLRGREQPRTAQGTQRREDDDAARR